MKSSILLPCIINLRCRPGSDIVEVTSSMSACVDGQWIFIPQHARTDGNSVPWFVEWVIPRYGWALTAGIIHDVLPRSIASDTVWRKVIIELALRRGSHRWWALARAWIGWSILVFTTVSGLRVAAVKIFGESK
jgi:hypothetical protein